MVWKPRGRGAPSSLMNRLFALSFGIASAGGGGAAWTRAEEWRSIAAAEAEAPQANKFACLPFTHASATPRPDTSKRGVKKKCVGAGVAVVWFKVQSASTSSAPALSTPISQPHSLLVLEGFPGTRSRLRGKLLVEP